MEISVNLPSQTILEQIELKFHQDAKRFGLFEKYLKVAGVTKRHMANQSSVEDEYRITQDIQLTVHNLTDEQLKKSKYAKMTSGFLDREKRTMELNYQGAVCNQLNIQFCFDNSKARELIAECKEIMHRRLGKDEELAHRRNQGASNQVSATQSYFVSSYENEMTYDVEGSERDELDNEVSNNLRRMRNENDGLKHEEIELQMMDEHSQNNGEQINSDYTPDQKDKFQERKLFQGENYNLWAQRLLQHVLQSVKVYGFNMNKIPAITNLAHLMNISFSLRKEKHYIEDVMEVDFMLGTLLISSKRNTQAIEVLRNKVQKVYLQQIQANLDHLSREDFLTYDEKAKVKVQTKKLYTRSALIELMCSESMCIRPQINDKLRSLVRMTQLCRGQMVEQIAFGNQIFLGDDEYTTIVKILPFMLKFSIQCIDNSSLNNKEIIIVSAIRNIQFILETQGCSLDSAMIFILKAIFKCYPDKTKQEKIKKKNREMRSLQPPENSEPKTLLSQSRKVGGFNGTGSANELFLKSQNNTASRKLTASKEGMPYHLNLNTERENIYTDNNRMERLAGQKMSMIESLFQLTWMPHRDEPTVRKEPNSGFEKTQMNLYNSLLDTYISVLSSISSHILHQIFYEVIMPCLTNQPFDEDKARISQMDKDDQLLHSELCPEIKIYAVKIAEKIITICQGDLVINKTLLDILVKTTSNQSFKKQMEMSGSAEQLRNQMKNLWSSIRTKVFTNYSMKGFKQLIEWLVSKMSLLAQNCTILDGKSSASEIAMLELSEDDLMQLSQYLEIINFISVGRRNNQEEANSLIKIKYDFCMDLYLLLNPLLFWLDFSVEREERLNLFKQVYSTIKNVLDNLPPKKVDIDILQIIIPILQRTSEYLRENSPTQSMLKFLDIVLTDIKVGKFCQTSYPDLKLFFLDQLNSLVNYISFCLYEDIFPVFDKLLTLCQDTITDRILKKCILALVDKYTLKNKAQKSSIQSFMKSLIETSVSKSKEKKKKQPNPFTDLEMIDIYSHDIQIDDPEKKEKDTPPQAESTFFDIMLQYCFFENDDEPAKVAADILKPPSETGGLGSVDDSILRFDKSLQFRSPLDLHEIYIDKLQFFIDALNMLGERHTSLFNKLLFHPKFKSSLFALLERGETSIRLKCHEILEILGSYYIQYISKKILYELAIPQTKSQQIRNGGPEYEVMEVDYISTERLYIAQLIVQCVSKSFQINNRADSYLQFNSLILLDYLFQNILPVPTFQNELLKSKQNYENEILQNKFLKQAAASSIEEAELVIKNLNDSHIEEGSSGGEGTAIMMKKNASGEKERTISPERKPNANYLGKFEEVLDLETCNINEQSPELEVTDVKYTSMRLKCVFKLWPFIQDALNSPWSNIRSICYGLICSMLKIDVMDCYKYIPFPPLKEEKEESKLDQKQIKERQLIKEQQEKDQEMLEQNKFYIKLRQYVIPMMLNLLSSKESESKAGGLNILGSICGLSYDFTKIKIQKNLEFFMRNSEFISLPIWQLVFDLQDDWDITIKEASIVLIQLCAPRDAVKYFNKCKVDHENQVFQQMFNKMAKSGGSGAHGQASLSNLSSARQNSAYMNSKSSLKRNENDLGSKIDYKQVDFGYKNKKIPNIPGIVVNEYGKIDMATFLNDQQDMIHLDDDFSDMNLDDNNDFPNSARVGELKNPMQIQEEEHMSANQFMLDLRKVHGSNDQIGLQAQKGVLDIEAAMQQHSLSNRSNYFGGQNHLNQQILLHQQQQNQQLAQAMQGSPSSINQLQANTSIKKFEFFVDQYNDEQIQEIISIFRNDFKPPKNLWIEKTAENSFFNAPDYYNDIFTSAIEQFNQQQMILQQKQQQELQDQVSSAGSVGSTSPNLSPDKNQPLPGVSRNNQELPAFNRNEMSPPAPTDEKIHINISNEQQVSPASDGHFEPHTQSQIHQTAEAAQQKILQNLSLEKDEMSPSDSDKLELLNEGSEEKKAQPEKPEISTGQPEQKPQKPTSPKQESAPPANKPFNPATDLNIFEQFNFDDMNINIEDINQNNQKQEVINSSDSDIGMLDMSSGNGHLRNPEAENSEVVEDSEDCTREDNILKKLEEKENAQNLVFKINQMGQIGTELQIIESMSNEVSETVEENQPVEAEAGGVSNRSRPDLAVLSGSSDASNQNNVHPNYQDQILEEMEKKNSKVVESIQMEQQQIHAMQPQYAHMLNPNSIQSSPLINDEYGTSEYQTLNENSQQNMAINYPYPQGNNVNMVHINSAGNSIYSGDGVMSGHSQASGQVVLSQNNMYFQSDMQQIPFQAKTQVVDMGKHNTELRNELEYYNQQQQLQQMQNQYEQMNKIASHDEHKGLSKKVSSKNKLTKQVSNSNSTPDFQMVQFDSQNKAKLKAQINNKGYQSNHAKQYALLSKQNPSHQQKSQNEFDHSNKNFMSQHQPLTQNNFGSYTQRVQPSKPNIKQTGGVSPNSNVNMTKKQILKNLQQIKTNNEDYKMMQNISNNMAVPYLSQQPNTTKHSKNNDKSFQNLKVAFKQSLQGSKGGTSLGKSIPQSLMQEFQSSDESGLTSNMNLQKQLNNKSQSKNRAKSAGKKKTLSISPHRQNQTEISNIIGTGYKNTKGMNTNSGSVTSGGNRVQKTHRVTSGGASLGVGQPMTQNQIQQMFLSTSSNNSKKMKENMKDLNYFIKTIEKFSKSSNLNAEGNQQVFNNNRQPPQIMNINQLSNPGGHISVSPGGGTASTPQTPKDMIQGILLNLGDQMKAYNSTQGQNPKKLKINTSKSKQNFQITQGPSQQQQQQQQQIKGVSSQTAEMIQAQLKKNGYNMKELNNILNHVQQNPQVYQNESGMRGHHGSSSSGRRNQQKQMYQTNFASGGSRGRSGGMFDNTPDSNSTSNVNMNANNNKVSSKKQKNVKYGSYSPKSRTNNSKSQKSSRMHEGSSNSRGAKGKSKGKPIQYNMNQPPQLKNQILMNYSQTQKFDLRDINQQLLANTNAYSQKGGSTQNKQVMLNQNSSNLKPMHSQREWIRDKSTGSSKSAQGQSTMNSQGGTKIPQQSQQFVFTSKNVNATPKYNNLLMANNKNNIYASNRNNSHNQYQGDIQSPKNEQNYSTKNKTQRSAKGSKQISSARSGGGSIPNHSNQQDILGSRNLAQNPQSHHGSLSKVIPQTRHQKNRTDGHLNTSKTPNKIQREQTNRSGGNVNLK